MPPLAFPLGREEAAQVDVLVLDDDQPGSNRATKFTTAAQALEVLAELEQAAERQGISLAGAVRQAVRAVPARTWRGFLNPESG